MNVEYLAHCHNSSTLFSINVEAAPLAHSLMKHHLLVKYVRAAVPAGSITLQRKLSVPHVFLGISSTLLLNNADLNAI